MGTMESPAVIGLEAKAPWPACRRVEMASPILFDPINIMPRMYKAVAGGKNEGGSQNHD